MLRPNDLSSDQINVEAESFLTSYHPIFSLPIPIEEIIDLKLGINIVSIPGLKNDLGKIGFDVDAFIMSNFKDIMVDEYIYNYVNTRFRFSLAHEIGHMILHKELYRQKSVASRDEYIEFIRNLNPKILDVVEKQADEFAGLVLIPRKILEKEFTAAVSQIEKLTHVSIQDDPKFIISEVTENILSRKFNVSSIPIEIRLKRDKLI